MNSGQIVKSKTANEYVTITNKIARGSELSLKAKGLLLHLLSLPHDWVLYKANLYSTIKDKKGSIDSAFKELQDKGFILSVKVCDALGRFVGWNHVVYDIPAEIEKTRQSENPKSVKSEMGESSPIQINTYTKKDNIQINNKDKELAFLSEDWKDLWEHWVEYKKTEHRDKFKSKNTEQLALNNLVKISKERIEIARKIVSLSIINRWKGLFEMKEENKPKDKMQQYLDHFEQAKREINGTNYTSEADNQIKRLSLK
jgi:hypothetical protein